MIPNGQASVWVQGSMTCMEPSHTRSCSCIFQSSILMSSSCARQVQMGAPGHQQQQRGYSYDSLAAAATRFSPGSGHQFPSAGGNAPAQVWLLTALATGYLSDPAMHGIVPDGLQESA